MNKKEQEEFGRAWALVAISAVLAFFVGIAANGFYASLIDFSWKSFGIFIFFAVLSLVLIDILSFGIENIKKFKKMSDWKFFKFWLNSRFKK